VQKAIGFEAYYHQADFVHVRSKHYFCLSGPATLQGDQVANRIDTDLVNIGSDFVPDSGANLALLTGNARSL